MKNTLRIKSWYSQEAAQEDSGRGDVQVGFFSMNRSLPKRQDLGVGDTFQVEGIVNTETWRCENSLILRSLSKAPGLGRR